jgi:hypothetical protein
MTPARKKRLLLFLPPLLIGLFLSGARYRFESKYGTSLAQGDLSTGFARLTDTERDIDETRIVTDEIAAESGGAFPRSTTPVTRESSAKLRALRTAIRAWAPLCEDGSLTYAACPYPEMLRFAGLLCLSGDFKACEQVHDSRDETGRFYRGPSWIGRESDSIPSFSSSAARGVIAYLTARSDRESAKEWIRVIRKDSDRFCPDLKDPDNECRTRAYFWHLAWQLNQGLQFLPEEESLRYLGFLVVRNEDAKRSNQDKGYDLNGTAETIYVLKEMKRRGIRIADEDLIDAVAAVLFQRHPDHALLRTLVLGPDESTARFLLSRCPEKKPFPRMTDGWPRFDVELQELSGQPPVGKPGGHYCVFLINLLLGSAR